MIEVKDRIPTYPGRVKLTPVAGQANTYDMVRADSPVEPGTPINKALLDSKANVLTADITLYVNGSTGNDSTGDGSSAKPFKTVQKAVDSLPKLLNTHTATISIAAGWYVENLQINGFQGGTLVLGDDGVSVALSSIWVVSSSFVQINITTILNSNNGGLIAHQGSHVEIRSELAIDLGGNYNIGISATTGSVVGFTTDLFDMLGVDVSNCGFAAIYAGTGAKVHLSNVSGSGSAVGFRAEEGGVITYGTSTLKATTVNVTTKGGRIYSGSQTSIPKY